MVESLFAGVDPGQTGAIAVISETDQVVVVADFPGDEASLALMIRGWRWLNQIELAALEKVNAMPKQGVSSTFKFGVNVGTWRGVLATLQIPFLEPRPTEWQKQYRSTLLC